MTIPGTFRAYVTIGAMIVIACLPFAVLTMCSAMDRAKRAQSETKVAAAQAQVGQEASNKEADQSNREKAGADVTAANAEKINGANNAKDTAGDAGRRGQLAYCERQRVRGKSLPEYCA